MKNININKILITTFTLFTFNSFSNSNYTTTKELNVRSGGGMEYPVSFILKVGEVVEVVAKRDKWYKINFNGKTGYAYSKYLKPVDTMSTIVKDGISFSYVNVDKYNYTLLSALIVVCLLCFFIFINRILTKIHDKKLLQNVTGLDRGTSSERNLILKLLKYGIPAKNIFHDLYLKKSNGGFSQIDLVVITNVGVIVFEIKEYSGWIFGKGHQKEWTQVLGYGNRKYRFYNPILQNQNHILELKKHLYKLKKVPFYSVVVFYGNCDLRNIKFVPPNTFIVKSDRVLDFIKTISTNNEIVYYLNENELIEVLKEAVDNGGKSEIQYQHCANVKNLLGVERVYD